MRVKRLLSRLSPGDARPARCDNRECGAEIDGAAVRHATEGRSYCSMDCLLTADGAVSTPGVRG